MHTVDVRRRALGLALVLAVAGLGGAVLGAQPSVDAAACVRISGGNFDAPGNDNYAANLNGEYVKIHNYCSTTKSLSGWKLHDEGRIHVYTFASGFSLKAGGTVTVYSGRGTNSATRRYWGRSYGAIWNNDGETAYLRNASGTLQSRWSE